MYQDNDNRIDNGWWQRRAVRSLDASLAPKKRREACRVAHGTRGAKVCARGAEPEVAASVEKPLLFVWDARVTAERPRGCQGGCLWGEWLPISVSSWSRIHLGRWDPANFGKNWQEYTGMLLGPSYIPVNSFYWWSTSHERTEWHRFKWVCTPQCIRKQDMELTKLDSEREYRCSCALALPWTSGAFVPKSCMSCHLKCPQLALQQDIWSKCSQPKGLGFQKTCPRDGKFWFSISWARFWKPKPLEDLIVALSIHWMRTAKAESHISRSHISCPRADRNVAWSKQHSCQLILLVWTAPVQVGLHSPMHKSGADAEDVFLLTCFVFSNHEEPTQMNWSRSLSHILWKLDISWCFWISLSNRPTPRGHGVFSKKFSKIHHAL